MDNRRFYTYAWLRKDGTPYYIGKGTKNRAYREWDRNRNRKPPKDRDRILILKRGLTEEEAFRHECYMIAVFGRKDLGTGILINLTNGGEGVSGLVMTKETKDKMSKIRKGRSIPEAQKKLLSEAKQRRWLLKFDDGRLLEVVNLFSWAKTNNYSIGRLSELSRGKTKFHKDVVFVEKLGR
jgi:hypothetical protein